MAKKKIEKIVRYTTEELRRMPSRTNWARVAATTQAEVEAQIAEDPDDWLTDGKAVPIKGIPPFGRKRG